MSDELLPYYNRELAFIRRLGAEFAEAHPKIAGRLRLGPDTTEDPHVSRLIEAFAYLNARTRFKLEDDFPEITDAMLGVLYPHYLHPVPAMAILQFALDPAQAELTTGYTIPAGTAIETEPIQGEPCRFRTSYPVTVWPIEVESASLSGPPFTAPATANSWQAAAVLRLVLRTRSAAVPWSAMPLTALRFFLKGLPQHVYALYELLFNNVIEVALAGSPDRAPAVVLGADALRPVGFEADEGMLPYPARSFPGYRLLTEFFAFPSKFLFVDLTGLDERILGQVGNRLEVFIYLSRTSADLEQNLSDDTFRLGCTPMVNLFRQRAEPIPLTHTEPEYRVVPDVRRPMAMEVYSVDRVAATSPSGEEVEYLPFYSTRHAEGDAGRQAFWYATRRPAGRKEGQVDFGTEVFLTLVDLGFQPSAPADWTVDVETTCLNRDLPFRLPFGGDQPRMQLSEGGGPLAPLVCLTPPTRTLRPAFRHGARWRLISHLVLNHLSLEGEEGTSALREILKLYDFTDSADTRSMIDGVVRVSSRRIVGRVRSRREVEAFGKGVEVTVQFDEDRFSGSGLFLFASVLERFLALYCTVNSFTRLIATTTRREGELHRWPPRAGAKILL
ncbi:MAG TPA: type VI secretion system baseplate subunit TssF [Gemmataceae bacterium]|nr:type VI secretion system baseplate subunit TssF [Gemmataceae bacterium]